MTLSFFSAAIVTKVLNTVRVWSNFVRTTSLENQQNTSLENQRNSSLENQRNSSLENQRNGHFQQQIVVDVPWVSMEASKTLLLCSYLGNEAGQIYDGQLRPPTLIPVYHTAKLKNVLHNNKDMGFQDDLY